MSKITIEEADKLIMTDHIFKKGLTPYNLIVNGIVTYDDWLNAVKEHKNPEDDKYYRDGHVFRFTAFGKKLLKYIRRLGWTGIEPNFKFRRRSMNSELESIKLINMKFSVSRIED